MGIGASMLLWWEQGFCGMLADGGRFVIRYDHRDTGRSVTYEPGRPEYAGGGQHSRAFSTCATAACNASSTPTSRSTTTTAPTRAESPLGATPRNSSTVPGKWSPDEPHLSAHPGVCSA